MRTALFLVVVGVLGGLALLGVQSGDRTGIGSPGDAGGPIFEVHVERPRLNRPLFGILPTVLEDLMVADRVLEFDGASRGAAVDDVGSDRLELRADGWELVVRIDADGRIAEGTRVVFPITLANRDRALRCVPGERSAGYLRPTRRPGSDRLDGSFLVKLSRCEDAGSGRVLEWPASALTVHGGFRGLAPTVRETPSGRPSPGS
jgi:hypothetical protein